MLAALVARLLSPLALHWTRLLSVAHSRSLLVPGQLEATLQLQPALAPLVQAVIYCCSQAPRDHAAVLALVPVKALRVALEDQSQFQEETANLHQPQLAAEKCALEQEFLPRATVEH